MSICTKEGPPILITFAVVLESEILVPMMILFETTLLPEKVNLDW
jgi:hypothetical protein